MIFKLVCILTLNVVFAQSKPDFSFKYSNSNPLFSLKNGPKVGIDQNHNNLHTVEDGLFGFSQILKAEGFNINPNITIHDDNLSKLDILVIINALNSKNIGNWKRPILNAFNDDEIKTITKWVLKGGKLFLIADHMPYAGAIRSLANSFNVNYVDGFIINDKPNWPPELYTSDHIIKNGITENVNQIASFTGSAMNSNSDMTYISRFPKTHKLKIPETAWEFTENTVVDNIENYYLGGYKFFGKGRVFFGTEAAMFTAQIINDKYEVGVNSRHSKDNIILLRNIFKWLSNQNNDYQTVSHLLEEQAKAYTNNNMDLVANFYTDDAIIYEPTGREIIGKNDIQEYWNSLSNKAVSWTTKISEVERIGDQILAICEFDIKFKRGNDIVSARSKACLTFKIEKGKFKIFRDFYTPLPRSN